MICCKNKYKNTEGFKSFFATKIVLESDCSVTKGCEHLCVAECMPVCQDIEILVFILKKSSHILE